MRGESGWPPRRCLTGMYQSCVLAFFVPFVIFVVRTAAKEENRCCGLS